MDGKDHLARYSTAPSDRPDGLFLTVFAECGEQTAWTRTGLEVEVAKMMFARMLIVAKNAKPRL